MTFIISGNWKFDLINDEVSLILVSLYRVSALANLKGPLINEVDCEEIADVDL